MIKPDPIIDKSLLKEAIALGNHKTKQAAINDALREYVLRRRQWQIANLFGTIKYDSSYDYKTERKLR